MNPEVGLGVFALFVSIIAVLAASTANSIARKSNSIATDGNSIATRESAAAERSADEASTANSMATRSSVAADKAAEAAEEQTKIQEALRRGAAEPNLWADIRPADHEAQLILLLVGNSGPTVATNVIVTFDPPLHQARFFAEVVSHAEQRLNSGLASLPPGRTLAWSLGVAHQVLNHPDLPLSYTVTIRANDPFGPLEPLTYPLNLEDIRMNLSAAVPGTHHGVTEAIETLGKSHETLSTAASYCSRHRWRSATDARITRT